jgi:FlgD Ig-like domain
MKSNPWLCRGNSTFFKGVGHMIKAIIILTFFCAASAFAIPIDPTPDHIGVYFDEGATITSLDITPNVSFNAYVILTNTTGADIYGAEFSYEFVVPAGFEDSYDRLETNIPGFSIDTGNSEDISQGDYIVGLASPLPVSDAVVLATWELVFTSDFPMDIFLGPASRQGIEDGLPAYCDADSIRTLSPSSGSVDVPVASVNGGVSHVPGSELPALVALEQCYPNPFNPRTMIKYSLAREGHVSLSVHDVSGHLVRVLVDSKNLGPGEHEVMWDGLDSAGRHAPSGVYFYRIEALGASVTKRMTLVR